MAVIGSLSVKLGLVTVQWDQATAKAKQQAKELQGAVNALAGNFKGLGQIWNTVGGALGIGVGSFAALTTSALAFSNQVNDMSEGFGITIGQTLAFRNAVQTSGGTAEKAGIMMGKMFQILDEAGQGSEAAISRFERIGISFKDLEALSPEQMLLKVSAAIAKIDDAAKRASATKEFFGKGAIGVSLAGVSEKLQKGTKEYDEHAAAIKKVGQFADNLKTTMDNLKIAMVELISPFTGEGLIGINTFKALLVVIAAAATIAAVTTIVGQFIVLARVLISIRNSAAAITLISAIKSPVGAAAALAAGLGAIALMPGDTDFSTPKATPESESAALKKDEDEKEVVAKKQREIRRDELKGLNAQISLSAALIEIEKERNTKREELINSSRYANQIAENELKLKEQILQIDAAAAGDAAKRDLSEAQRGLIFEKAEGQKKLAREKHAAEYKSLYRLIDKESDLLLNQIDIKKQMQVFDFQRIELDRNKYYLTEQQYQQELLRLENTKKILELENQIVTARMTMGGGALFEREKERLQDEIGHEKKLYEAKKLTLGIDEQRRTSFTEGWRAAYRKYEEDSMNYAKRGEEAFSLVVDSMNEALANFVNTGKLNFKSLVQSIIQGLIRIQLQMQASKLFGMFSQMVLGSMGGGAALTAGGTPMIGSFPASVPMAAAGGFISGPTIVGENGPELFMPKSPGTIIPNQQMSGMGSGPSVVYNGPYIANMQAIDTQSAAQFLARNKESVWAANQSASRSVPQSR